MPLSLKIYITTSNDRKSISLTVNSERLEAIEILILKLLITIGTEVFGSTHIYGSEFGKTVTQCCLSIHVISDPQLFFFVMGILEWSDLSCNSEADYAICHSVTFYFLNFRFQFSTAVPSGGDCQRKMSIELKFAGFGLPVNTWKRGN